MRISNHSLIHFNLIVGIGWWLLMIRHIISYLANIYLSCVCWCRNTIKTLVIREIHIILRKLALFRILSLHLESFVSMSLLITIVLSINVEVSLNLKIRSILLIKLLSMHRFHISHKELSWSNKKSVILSWATRNNFNVYSWHDEFFQKLKKWMARIVLIAKVSS